MTEQSNIVSAAQQQQRPEQEPISVAEALNELSGCLALVRPVGMNEDLASEWLTVAANEIHGYPRWLVRSACGAARRECSHHGQIVAFVIKHMEKNYPHFDPNAVHRDRERALSKQSQPALIEQNPAVKRLIDDAASHWRA